MGDPAAMSTVDLVARIQEGDREAFNELFGRYLTRVENLVRSRLGPELRTRESISDIVQEAYLEALRTFDRFEVRGPQGFFRWLSVIVEHKIIDAHRHHFGAARRDARRQVSLEAPAAAVPPAREDETPSQIVLRAEAGRRLREALLRLPPDYRRVIELRQFEGLTSAEVGRRMNRSPEAVRALLVRALRRLAQEMHTPTDTQAQA